MKMLHKLMAGLLLFGATSLVAQNGMTPIVGENPEALKSRDAQQAVARVGDPVQTQNGNGFLGGPVYAGTECGLDYTTTTVKLGQRFFPPGVPQPATFTIGGVPMGPGVSIVKAFIWCDASGDGSPINLTVVNPIGNGFSIPAAFVGIDVDKCWGYAGSTTYRADITAAISAISPNGNYTISGFPTGFPNDVDGATMVVIWKDMNAGFQGDLVIWDGALTRLGVGVTQTVAGFSACNGTIFNAKAFMGIGDLQGFNSQLTLNGMGPYTVVEDWWNFLEVPTTVFPTQNTSTFGNNVGGDCYNIAVYGLYWQSDCKACEFECEAKPDFKWDGCNPIQFDGRNDGASPVVGWFWQFGDGQTSTLEDPLHTYANPGTYEVCLTIISVSSKGETCCEQICHKVEACPPPPCTVKPEFHWFSLPNNPTTAYFSDATSFAGDVICNYKIDFGDGSPTYSGPTMPNYHIYPSDGSYEVCMLVTVCIYDDFGNLIEKCEEKVCHKVVVGPNANSGRFGPRPAPTMPGSGFEVFPSPAAGELNIMVEGENPVIRIVDMNGKQVGSAQLAGKNYYRADVSALAPGVYIVISQNANGTVNQTMFVKE